MYLSTLKLAAFRTRGSVTINACFSSRAALVNVVVEAGGVDLLVTAK